MSRIVDIVITLKNRCSIHWDIRLRIVKSIIGSVCSVINCIVLTTMKTWMTQEKQWWLNITSYWGLWMWITSRVKKRKRRRRNWWNGWMSLRLVFVLTLIRLIISSNNACTIIMSSTIEDVLLKTSIIIRLYVLTLGTVNRRRSVVTVITRWKSCIILSSSRKDIATFS